MTQIKSERSVGIDILKSIAILFILCVHFFSNTNYYYSQIDDFNMFVQSCMRWLFLVGVPIFIMCTGYLNYQKTISRSYYLKIIKVLIPYIVISILCIIVDITINKEQISFQEAVFSIFNFSANTYSWYINMYIGLFLLAPIMNIVINSLDKKKMKIVLFTLIFVISIPATLDSLYNNNNKIAYISLPDWWRSFYPIFYYFVGAYIAKYQIKIKKIICILLIVTMIPLQTFLQIIMNRYEFNNWLFTDYSSLFIVAESLGLFLLFYSSGIKNPIITHTAKFISTLTLEIYLFSNITDLMLYPYFESHFYGCSHFLTQEMIFKNYFLIIVPLSFLSSLLLSTIFHLIYTLCKKAIYPLIKKAAPKESIPDEKVMSSNLK